MKTSLAIPHLASLAIRNDAVFTSPGPFNPILEADRSTVSYELASRLGLAGVIELLAAPPPVPFTATTT
jgi:hypothetical protein